MAERQVLVCTCSSLAKAIRSHGLPVSITIPGSGLVFTISRVGDIREKGRRAIAAAQSMGNGMVCK